MDYVWSPWRYQYVVDAEKSTGCVFCRAEAERRDAHHFIVHRAEHSFIILNRFPYTSGHLMIVPYQHAGALDELDEPVVLEMARLVRESVVHLKAIYHPDGLNVGMNLGKCAGAGVAEHLHTHVLPRWVGDSSFVTVVGETRILPEDLATTYQKLSNAFAR